MNEESFEELSQMLCECGHSAEDHHVSWWRGGGRLIEECEYYGWNEHGGMVIDEAADMWVDHCHRFRRVK